jgi:hypothetical protein
MKRMFANTPNDVCFRIKSGASFHICDLTWHKQSQAPLVGHKAWPVFPARNIPPSVWFRAILVH